LRDGSSVFQWDNTRVPDFWLVRDHLPEFAAASGDGPSLVERARVINAEAQAVPIPWDCVDGFFHAHWRRPRGYLREDVRRGTSVWARVGAQVEQRAVEALGRDLASGAGQEHHQDLIELPEADLGARLLVAFQRP